MACILFLVSGVQLFCTGLVGIYLSKTYLETKHRPIYLLKETSEETVKMHSVQPVKKQERKTEIMTEAIENTENYMEEITAPTVQKLPLLAMRGIVLFPNMIMHFDLAREPFVKALRAGAKSDRRVFLVTQKDPLVEEPKQDYLYTVRAIAEVRQVLHKELYKYSHLCVDCH